MKNKINSVYLAILFLFACFLCGAVDAHCQSAPTFQKVYEVSIVSVHDGDTIRLKFNNGFEFDARLHGIDAPELQQSFGATCKAKLETIVAVGTFKIFVVAEDTFNRKLVQLFRPDYSVVNFELVEQGCAWIKSPLKSEKEKYKLAFRVARAGRVGLFVEDDAIDPRVWRKNNTRGVRNAPNL